MTDFTYAVCVELTPKDLGLRAVTDPGLFRKRLKAHFLVKLSVSADDTNDSVMHL